MYDQCGYSVTPIRVRYWQRAPRIERRVGQCALVAHCSSLVAANRATAFNFFGALSSVRNIKFASSLAHGASTCVFDLLTGLFIRAIHRMALIPAPLKPAIFLMNFHILLVSMTNKRLNGAPPLGPSSSILACSFLSPFQG